ncbi:hypothetical protein ANANG_G00032920 [Anguilla anguilla]|uniref:Sulfotransferase n=1 Tax=Anguilla anguilla TaxID=7936 RepID=A0A9D3S6W8_ANGAN|nr:hypothetical protein ANANG_G00032920 [Anguilla anguilla]
MMRDSHLCRSFPQKKRQMAQQEYKLLSEFLFTYKGCVYPVDDTLDLTPEYLDSLEHFEIRDSDLYVITFPKSGTVWTQRIVTLLYENDFPDSVDSDHLAV